MSQEKVDRYKKEKANRKQTVMKQKRQNALRKCIVGLIGILLVVWIGYSGYSRYEENKPKTEVAIDYSALGELTEQLSQSDGATDTAE